MPRSARRKSGNAALVRAFDPIRDRADAGVMPGPGSLRNFALRVRNHTHIPTPHGGSAEFRALFANPPKEKIARYPRCRLDFRANFRQLQVAQTNKRSMAKATTAQETDARRAIAN